MKKHVFFIILSAFFYYSCQRSADLKLVTYRGLAQGTTFQIKFYSDSDSSQIKNGIDSIFRLIDYTASIYDSNSIISKVNDNRDVELNEHFITIFNRSQEVSKATDGYFDITIAPLVKAWGFWRKKGIDLTQKQVDSLKSYVDYQKVSISGGTLIKAKPEMMIDYNAIAQGYTDDVVADYLISKGCKDFLIEIGGEVLAKGLKNGKEKWLVGIEKPAANASADQILQEKVALTDKAMATSGNYRKFIIKDGIKYSHTIDPHTGYPAHHSLLSVTVLANDCATADAYATAFSVMGLEKAKAFLSIHPEMDAYFICSDSSGNFKTEFTKGFSSLIVK
jgi:FAD:protein FMN transferase